MYEKPVELLKASGVDLSMGGVLEELEQFQAYVSENKIVVFDGFISHRVMFGGNSPSLKKLYLFYDADYNVITILKAGMAKTYMCNACDTLYNYSEM